MNKKSILKNLLRMKIDLPFILFESILSMDDIYITYIKSKCLRRYDIHR